jgi:basic membrane protein A and related proteins
VSTLRNAHGRVVRRRLVAVGVAAATVASVALATGSIGSASTPPSNGGSEASTAPASTPPADSGASASSPAAAPTAGGEPLKVYGVFATALEEPWDGAIHTALQTVADSGAIEYKYVDGLGTADAMESALRDIINSEHPDLIVGDAFAAEDAVRRVAADNPDTAFAFGSGLAPQDPNFSVFDNWLQDPAFLGGMLAGGLTETGTIGVVAAMPIPEVNRIVNAFVDGVAETNADATVKVSFINSFFDPATARQAAEAQIAQGADVLFAERAGVIEAAEENDLPVIGMMVDQHDLAPNNVVTSLIWNMQPTIEALVQQVSDGTYTAQNLAEYSYMVNGGSSIAPINTDLVVDVPSDLVDQVEAKQAEILDGTFTTPIDEEAPAGSIDVTQST